jgi:hypothetical protein
MLVLVQCGGLDGREEVRRPVGGTGLDTRLHRRQRPFDTASGVQRQRDRAFEERGRGRDTPA